MESHRPHSFLPPPPPLTAEKAPVPAEKIGIEQELESLASKKRSESEVQEVAAGKEMLVQMTTAAEAEEEGGRERLKRHRREMAGRVWIPDIWGQEELLKEWIDCSGFDACLFPTGIGLARAALVEEGRRANNGGFRVENRC
ncbi:protein BIC1-like [Cucurbita pepo subsp. pepo]|uniref:protein BIC1-like n=1 Tax=Cucurbita pepo subsp. pepo TaxID=3664 RepID=UPI000C9D4BAE|nr:protein BIC1-like [Cucurbita pepo subsp. pepo]